MTKQYCRVCGHLLTGAMGVETPDGPRNASPKPGDVTLCLQCGELHVFTPKLKLRLPTDGEKLKLMLSVDWPYIRLAQKAIHLIKAQRKR